MMDPLVIKLAEIGAADERFVHMLNDVEKGIFPHDIQKRLWLNRVEGVLKVLTQKPS